MEYKTKKLKRVAAVLFTVFLVAGLALAALRVWLLATHFDVATGFFDRTSVLPTVYCAACYGLVALAFLSAFVLGRRIRIVQTPPSAGAVFAGAFCGFLILASVVLSLLDLPGLIAQSGFVWAVLVLSLPAAFYFILCMVTRDLKMTPRTLLCFAVIFWAIVSLMNLYFEKTLVINNPAKVAEQLALIGTMIYLLYECRFIVGRPRPAVFLASGSAAVILLSCSALPNIVAAFFMGRTMTTGLAGQIAELGVLIYIIFRVGTGISHLEACIPAAAEKATAKKQ